MRLTVHTDYAIRTLIFLAIRDNKLATISDISERYQISKNHLMKVAQELVHHEFVISERGRNGGLRLARPPSEINLGDVIQKMEADFYLVSCLDPEKNNCKIIGNCGAQSIMHKAIAAFIDVFRQYTLEDAVINEKTLKKMFLTELEINDT
ncbi:nitric oxide-sensing transcriptional repressor NsrR [Hyphomicrobiales bacterium 4NK60-0047b]|jgi:Rrf2 family nitric oxide-sensitive transcriptional repressor